MTKNLHEDNKTILTDAYEELYDMTDTISDITERIDEALEEINDLTLEIVEYIEPLYSRLYACRRNLNKITHTHARTNIVNPEEELPF